MNLLNHRYRIIKELGAGGFGNTYLAEDTQMPSQRCCVIKQLKPITYNPQVHQLIQDRFAREAAVLEKLGDNSRQIPRLYAYFTENDLFYLVQEWIDGVTLTKKVQDDGILNESEVRQILTSLLAILNFVHKEGIVHRDIKPDNIILRSSDRLPVLIDFGAVRETVATQLNSQGQTTSSIVIGTPGFMPSEQAAGRPVYSSDLYSLSLTAIYLLTGKMPQQLATDPTTGEIIWDKQGITPSLAAVLDTAARYHPRERFATASEMLQALQTGVIPNYQPTTVSPGFVPPPNPNRGGSTVAVAPHTPVSDNRPSSMGDWQKAAVVGGAMGAVIIGGLALTNMLPNSRQSEVAQSPSPAPSTLQSTNPPPSPVIPPASTPISPATPPSPFPASITQPIERSTPSLSQPDCSQYLAGFMGLYAGRAVITNTSNRLSGRITLDISYEPSCIVVAKLEEFSPLGGKGILRGKFDPSVGSQLSLTGTLNHQSKPKVWDVDMKLGFLEGNNVEGTTTWKPKSGVSDTKIYYEEFTASKPSVANPITPDAPAVAPTEQLVTARKSPEEFIREHYSLLNDRNYSATWGNLTSNFRGKSDGFSGYTNWWDSVKYSEVRSINTLEQSDRGAILDVKLRLHMRKGTTYNDPSSRFYLVWDRGGNTWKIDRKQKP